MLLSLLLAGLTGFFVHKRKWGAATFCGLLFLWAMWAGFVGMFLRTSSF